MKHLHFSLLLRVRFPVLSLNRSILIQYRNQIIADVACAIMAVIEPQRQWCALARDIAGQVAPRKRDCVSSPLPHR